MPDKAPAILRIFIVVSIILAIVAMLTLPILFPGEATGSQSLPYEGMVMLLGFGFAGHLAWIIGALLRFRTFKEYVPVSVLLEIVFPIGLILALCVFLYGVMAPNVPYFVLPFVSLMPTFFGVGISILVGRRLNLIIIKQREEKRRRHNLRQGAVLSGDDKDAPNAPSGAPLSF